MELNSFTGLLWCTVCCGVEALHLLWKQHFAHTLHLRLGDFISKYVICKLASLLLTEFQCLWNHKESIML